MSAVLLTIGLFGINVVIGATTSYTFTPTDETTSFGEVSLMKGSIASIPGEDDFWHLFQAAQDTDLQMALRTTIYAGSNCNINDIDVSFNIIDTSNQADAAIVISTGNQYVSMIFDGDGGILLSQDPNVNAGLAVYPQCTSNTLGSIPDNQTDANYLLQGFDKATEKTPFWAWRSRLAGGDNTNWDLVINSGINTYQRNKYTVGYTNDIINNQLIVRYRAISDDPNIADIYHECIYNTLFTFTGNNDANIYFTPDYNDETWNISSIDVNTDCSALTEEPTPIPSLQPTQAPEIECNYKCNDNIQSCLEISGNEICESCDGSNPFCKYFSNIKLNGIVRNIDELGGCSECKNGYFMKNKYFPCVHCKNTIDGCVSCMDYQGCIQCSVGYQYYWDTNCKIGKCRQV